MAGHRHVNQEGIRFLDEAPVPTGPVVDPRRKRRREWPVGVLSFLLVVGVGVALKWGGGGRDVGAREVIEQRFEVGPAPRIEVEASEGSVRVERGDGHSVSCRVELRARGRTDEDAFRALDRLRASVDGGAGVVRVRIERTEGGGRWNVRSEVRLEVPADADVRVATGSGKVRVEEVRGSIAVRADNGRIEVRGASGPIVLRTSNGPIDVEARDALVSAETSNGAIRFRGSLAPGTSRMVAGNGAVSVRLPEHGRYRIDAASKHGRVESDFPTGPDGSRAAVVLAGRPDEPGTRVELRTNHGPIRVEKD